MKSLFQHLADEPSYEEQQLNEKNAKRKLLKEELSTKNNEEILEFLLDKIFKLEDKIEHLRGNIDAVSWSLHS